MASLSRARATIQFGIYELIGDEAWEQFGHLTYREMADIPELVEYRSALITADWQDGYEQARERRETEDPEWFAKAKAARRRP